MTRKLFFLISAVFCYHLWSKNSSTPPPTSDPVPLSAKKTEAPPTALMQENEKLQQNNGFLPQEKDHANTIIKLFKQSQYEQAWAILKDDLRKKNLSAPYRKWLIKQQPEILKSLGWSHIKKKNCREGIDFLKHAEKLEGTTVATAKGLAYCHYLEGLYISAEDQFLWLQKKQAQLEPEFLSLYGDILESQNRFNESIQLLEQLLLENPNEALKQKLKNMKNKQKEGKNQQKLESEFFSISYRPEDFEYADLAVTVLEKQLNRLTEIHRFKPPEKVIEVLLYPANVFRDISGNSPHWASGIFDGRIRIPISDEKQRRIPLSAFENVLKHELVHAVLSQSTGYRRLPTWFDEGLAQFFSCPQNACVAKVLKHGNIHFLPPKNLIQPFIKLNKIDAKIAYAQSLYLIATIVQLYGLNRLQDMISNITAHTAIDSDSLIMTTNHSIKFNEIRLQASQLWKQRQNLTILFD